MFLLRVSFMFFSLFKNNLCFYFTFLRVQRHWQQNLCYAGQQKLYTAKNTLKNMCTVIKNLTFNYLCSVYNFLLCIYSLKKNISYAWLLIISTIFRRTTEIVYDKIILNKKMCAVMQHPILKYLWSHNEFLVWLSSFNIWLILSLKKWCKLRFLQGGKVFSSHKILYV